MSADAVVVGGGVAGLSSALLLARQGRRVTVVEKAPRPAPVLRGFSRWGVSFDTGFHYAGGLGEGQCLDRLLRALGVGQRLRTRPMDAEGFDRFECAADGFTFRLPSGYSRVRERLCGAFPGEARAVDGYLAEVREICRLLPYVNLDADLAMEALGERRWLTLETFLDRLGASPRLKAVLSMHCLLHGAGPSEVSLPVHASVTGPYLESAHAVEGGGRSLAEAFEAELADQGVTVRCGRAASRLLLSEGGAVAGVELDDGERIGCRACVAAVHPRTALALAPSGAFRPVFARRVAALEESPSAYLLFAAAESGLEELAGCNRYYFPDPASRGWVTPAGAPVARRPLYVTSAWRDGEPSVGGLVAVCPAEPAETAEWADSAPGRRPDAYLAHKARIAETLRGNLERWWPAARGLKRVEVATPLTLRRWAGSPFGSLYGVKHRVDQHNPSAATRVPGLVWAGQATAAPGLLGAVVSAFVACGHLVGHDRLRDAARRAH